MPLLLTCDCGARFEVDEHLGGREVSCPECLQPVQTAVQNPSPRADWVALFSVALALVGGLTVVGGVAAAVAGVVALVRIRRWPGVLAGQPYAIAGILLGLGLAAISLVLVQLGDALPVGAWVRQRRLAGQLDTTNAMPLGTRDGVCLLPRPPAGWGVLTRGSSGDPAVDDLQQKREFVLANPALRAYADLHRDADHTDHPLPLYIEHLRQQLGAARKPLLGEDDDENPLSVAQQSPKDVETQTLPTVEGYEAREWVFDLPRGGVTWRFLVRLYRRPGNRAARPSPTYVFRVYAPRGRFQAAETDLRALADGLRLTP
jgi:hypothetical protein